MGRYWTFPAPFIRRRMGLNMSLDPTGEKILSYLNQMIDCFQNDPPSSQFQRGYLAALKDVRNDLFLTEEERRILIGEETKGETKNENG
jgi:hypothetical protein